MNLENIKIGFNTILVIAVAYMGIQYKAVAEERAAVDERITKNAELIQQNAEQIQEVKSIVQLQAQIAAQQNKAIDKLSDTAERNKEDIIRLQSQWATKR